MKDRRKTNERGGALRVRRLLKPVSDLKPLPNLLYEIVEAVESPNTSAQELGDIIERDVALAARLLRLVNSAWYGSVRQVGSVQHAIVLLGFQEVRSLAVTACLLEAYPVGGTHNFQPVRFWRHSVEAANAARNLAARVPQLTGQQGYLAGLLHDMGKLVFGIGHPEAFDEAISRALNTTGEERPLREVEREILGADHTEVGAALAEKWKLPENLVRAIALHHDPEQAGSEDPLVHIVHLANIASHALVPGASGNPVPGDPHPFSLQTLRLRPAMEKAGGEKPESN